MGIDKKNYCFRLEMEVRDYELDCEQIVNNANYLHYLEHTRHKFCEAAGFPFIEMHRQGIDAVVRRLEMEYFVPLRSGDRFVSKISLKREGARFVFYQDIEKMSGEKVVEAVVTIVALKNGRMSKGEEIAGYFERYFEENGC